MMRNLERSHPILEKQNLLRGLGLAIGIALAYFVPNHLVIFPTHSVVLTPLDHWIRLTPVWVWFYISYYPLLAGAYLYSSGTSAQKVFVGAMWLSGLVGLFVFFFFPTHIQRELYPWLGGETLSSWMLELVRGADNSVNCLPSMHVCMSFIAASTFTLICGRTGRTLVWALFLGICYSTMATKQHYFVDLIAGFGLGLTCVAIMAKRYGVLPDFGAEGDETSRNSWRLAAPAAR